MKTIFITSFHPLISRNILASGLLARLAREAKIIILAPDFKLEYFQKEFGGDNIEVAGIKGKLAEKDIFFRKLALFFCPTRALRIKYRAEFLLGRSWFYFLFYLPLSQLGRFKFFINFLRAADRYYSRPDLFGCLIEKYRPDLIFSTDVQNEFDVNLLQEARKKNIAAVGMVRSWDNLTAKGIIRALPAKLIASNEIIKREAVRFSGVKEENIIAVGIPHYDRYLEPPRKNKTEFFRELGLDENKKLILFTPIGNRYISDNKTDEAVLSALADFDVNILVRLPPGDLVNFDNWTAGKAKVVFEQPGKRLWKGGVKTNEISKEDDERLVESIWHASLVVGGPSTICLDAAALDRPIVLINFDDRKRKYYDSVSRYYDYNHFVPIVKSGGVKLAKSAAELKKMVDIYLANPELDKAGRQRIIREEAYLLDGGSTGRLAEFITKYLNTLNI